MIVTVIFKLQAIRQQCFGGPGDRRQAKNVAVIITDGVPSPADRYQPATVEAEILRTEYSKIFNSIGIVLVSYI